MERFVRRQNIKHYRHLLESTTDEAERNRLRRLIAEERQKQIEAGDPDVEELRC